MKCFNGRLLDSLTFSGLAKVAFFNTNVDAENQTLINHKSVCGALNRHFCQTRVTSWPSVFRCCSVHCLQCLGALACKLFLFFLSWLVCQQKNKMCLQMRWHYVRLNNSFSSAASVSSIIHFFKSMSIWFCFNKFKLV